jgi:hypothetical protein
MKKALVTLHLRYTVDTCLLHCCYTVLTLLLRHTVVTLSLHCCCTFVPLLERSYPPETDMKKAPVTLHLTSYPLPYGVCVVFACC